MQRTSGVESTESELGLCGGVPRLHVHQLVGSVNDG